MSSPETNADSASARAPSCVLIGSESLLIQCGELLLNAGWGIRRVVSKEETVLSWARKAGLETSKPGKGVADELAGASFDYLFSITNLSIIPESVLALADRGAINFHDGPLPNYAGMYTPAWAILNGESEYGITFHEMTAGIDEGRIFVQRRFPIAEDDTSLTLNTSCYAAAIEGFGELIEGLSNDTLTPREQDLEGRSYFGRHERPEAAGVIDWNANAETIANAVRAMDFGVRYKNAFAVAKVFQSGRVVLVRNARVIDSDSKAAPGTVLELSETEWQVRCADGAVALSGFSTPRGADWTAREAAAALDIEAGSFLAGVSDRVGLAALNDATTPSEAFWVRRLSSLDPVEAPYRREAGASRSDEATRRVERVEVSLTESSGQDQGLRVLASFALYLARIQGHSDFDLTWSDDVLDARVASFGELFSAFVPLRISVDAQDSASAALTSVLDGIGRTRNKGSFLSDAISRDPKLSAHAMLAAGDWTSVAMGLHENSAQTPLPSGADLGFFVNAEGSVARLVYDADSLDETSIAAIQKQIGVFSAALSEADRPLAQLSFLDQEERSALLNDWNQTAVEFDRSATVRSLFEAQVERTPDAIAVVFEGESLSYRELDERAGRLANTLRAKGIGPDELVGLHLARSIDMIVGVMAVLKSGGAYVPLDPAYPADRIAYMIEDSKARVVLTHSAACASPDQGLPASLESERIVDLDRDAAAIDADGTTQSQEGVDATLPEHLAYLIYTSGSTGKPKGVMVEHRNVVNFFVGMDERVDHTADKSEKNDPGVWLALTSLSFDISVLELLWTLTRGFKVVIFMDHDRTADAAPAWRPIDLGLALWGSDAGPGPRKYELMLESAKFADERGFHAVHTPERHFGAFGGPFPNPSVTSAAIAAVTKRVLIRASSCVLPLHHPVRVAEEWAVVDNISNGRVGISFAAGWQPNDFVLRPEAFATAKTAMFENAEIVKKLWAGEPVEFENPHGKKVATATLPRPVQTELPSWITTAGNIDTFREAGAKGFNVLSHLLGQSLGELAEKVKAYRNARQDAGLDPATGVVTCMLHTFVGDSDEEVRELVREPMKEYLASAMKLVMDFAWSFPAFERPGGPDSKPEDVDLSTLTHEETDAILEFAFYRYFETSGLFGTRETCERMLQRVKDADIDEVACLIDFGVDTDVVLQSLDALDDVRKAVNEKPAELQTAAAGPSEGYSFAEQVERHGVTHLQCTPSHATMLLVQPESRGAMGRIKNIMIGGEAFPVSLAAELDGVASGSVTNMYGPTETTIWSSTEPVEGRPDSISIGTPIANTQLYILDAGGEPLPIGVAGELLIGGEGVVRGYFERPELTAERFVPDPFSDRPNARLYRTGDLARWSPDGRIEFLGRLDHQVKIRGYRIELGEIEARLASHAGVRECVAIAREDSPGDLRLVAYAIAETEPVTEESLKMMLRETLPEFMVPAHIFFMERFPQTPNGKVDRKALPAPHELQTRSTAEYKAPENDLEEQIAAVWKEVLYLEQVGVNDNFFDLGGHSLLVVQAHRKMAESCPMSITLTDLYRFPTISGLSAHLDGGGTAQATAEASQARGEKRREALQRRRRGRKRS